MTHQNLKLFFFFCLLPLFIGRVGVGQGMAAPGSAAAALSVYAVAYGLPLPDPEQGGGSNPQNPLAFIRQTGPAFAAPDQLVEYAITLSNYEAMTRTFTLTNRLPLALTFVASSDRELVYHPATRELTWQGEIAPGHLDYLIEPAAVSLPYLDLALFGAPNLCDDLILTQGNCDDATITLNLGVNGYQYPFYGQTWYSLTLSPDGLLLLGEPGTTSPPAALAYEPDLATPRAPDAAAPQGHNQWLPNPIPPNALIAPLWYDVDMTHGGRWHTAILQGLIEGYDVLYLQWHNAPHATHPNITTRYAAALLLGDGPLSGQVFFIYDNITSPMALVQAGYTIGVEDYPGQRGLTYAYAPCCGEPPPPQGFPPAAGTTLQLHPVIYGQNYSRIFTYTVQVAGQVPQTIANTAAVTSNSPDPFLAYGWSTHYLYLRHLMYLPLTVGGDQ